MNEIAAFHLENDGHGPYPYPEDVAHFRAHLARLEPYLRQAVFDARGGWRRTLDLLNLEVSFSLWSKNRVGFMLGMHDPSLPDIYIGVYCKQKADGLALVALLDAHRHEILRHISWPREFSTQDTPVYTNLERTDPEHVCRRLAGFRTVLSPYIDRVCPRRARTRALKTPPHGSDSVQWE